jgi:hypothetical protein
MKGHCSVIADIDSAPVNVGEKLNVVLDPKESERDLHFDIPEGAKNPSTESSLAFRLTGTCTCDPLEALSRALLDGFKVVCLDDQVDGLCLSENTSFISHVFHLPLDRGFGWKVPRNIETPLSGALSDRRKVAWSAFFCLPVLLLLPDCEGTATKEAASFIHRLLGADPRPDAREGLHLRLLFLLSGEQSPDSVPFYCSSYVSPHSLGAKLLVCSITKTTICLIDLAGLGEAGMAKAISEICAVSEDGSEDPLQRFRLKMEPKIGDICGTFSIVDGGSKSPFVVLFPRENMFLDGLLLTNCTLKREAHEVLHSLPGGFGAKAEAMISRIYVQCITLAIGLQDRIGELLTAAPHLLSLLSCGQEGFLEAEQGSAEQIGGALGRAVVIPTEAKAREFTSAPFSKELPALGTRDFTDACSSWIVRLSLMRDGLAVVKLSGRK